MTSPKNSEFNHFQLKKMNLAIGFRSRRRLVHQIHVWVFWSEFDGKLKYRISSVRSGRNIELMGLTRGSNWELLLEIVGT